MSFLVDLKRRLPGIGFLTFAALVGFLRRVSPLVYDELGFPTKGSLTEATLVRPLSRVRPPVYDEV